MPTRKFSVFIAGEAKPQGSARTFVNKKTGKAILVSKSGNVSEWRQTIKTVVGLNWADSPLDGAVALSLVFVLPRPPSAPKGRVFPAVRPDADKLARAVGDALKGVAYTDDSRVVALCVAKVYGEQPGLHILMQEVDDGAALFGFTMEHGQRALNAHLDRHPRRER